MKSLLKFDKVLGYYKTGVIVVQLSDGRYAMIEAYSRLVLISNDTISFLRGKEITENIPDSLIEKAKSILESPKVKIRELR